MGTVPTHCVKQQNMDYGTLRKVDESHWQVVFFFTHTRTYKKQSQRVRTL
jgi:hypothetical protein